ncbi:MAG: ribosomal protein S18-alanine N-acetyltransferase [Neisseria sp.]
MKLRPAALADCAGLAALDIQCNPSAWSAQLFIQTMQQPENHIWLAENSDQLLGFIVWQTLLDESELHLIATNPNHRRQGVATQLLNQFFQVASTQNINRIVLEVRLSNITAHTFYRRHGFENCGQRKHYYATANGSYEDAVLMEKIC